MFSLCCAQCFLKIIIWLVETVINQSAQAIPRQRQLRLPLARGRWRDGMEMPACFGIVGNRGIHGNHELGHVEDPLRSKNRRCRCAAHNVLKNKTWLVEMVYSRSNIVLPAAVCRPSRRNRNFIRREVVFDGFLWIPLLDLNERPSEQALKYGESSGQ